MKTVIVLGLRSGSSTVAGLLHDLGIYMGENFRSPDNFNAKGYYEETEILDVVERVMLDGGRFNHRTALRNAPFEHLQQLKEVLNKHKKEPIWGFKAPGTTFVLDAVDLFVENPHYILCTRDITEVVQSLDSQIHHKYPGGFNATNWLNAYFHTMKNETRTRNSLEIDYNDMLTDPEKEFYRMIKFLGLDVTEKDRKRLVKRVDPSLKHHFSTKPVYKGFKVFTNED